MLKTTLKIVSLSLAIAVVSGCSNSESNDMKNKVEKSKGSEKSVLVECKSDKKEGSQFFNASMEILPMTDEVLDKVHKLDTQEGFTKAELPIYAIVKSIELFDKKSPIKDSCIKNMLFYGESPLDKLTEYEIKIGSVSESCEYAFFINLNANNEDATLLQPYKEGQPTGLSPFVSTCQIVK